MSRKFYLFVNLVTNDFVVVNTQFERVKERAKKNKGFNIMFLLLKNYTEKLPFN